MEKRCIICNFEGIYKCPTCLIYYCSVACCKRHREDGCKVVKTDKPQSENEAEDDLYTTPNTVPTKRLELLRRDETLRNMLKTNPHLREFLKTVDKAKNSTEIMEKAMQEPIFVEFADACLRILQSSD